MPGKGWTAYFVELKFESGPLAPRIFTTDARVIPDVRPHQWAKPRNPPSGNAGQ